MAGRKIVERIKFSAREIRAILFLLPILTFVAIVAVELAKRDRGGDEAAVTEGATDEAAEGATDEAAEGAGVPESVRLFDFDPNTVTYEELRLLGLDARTAAGLIKYRTAGKRFSIPEDLAACYGITDSIYATLKPCIKIGEEYRLEPRRYAPEHRAPEPRTPGRRTEPREQAPREKNSGSAGAEPTEGIEPLAPFDPNELDAGGFRALGFTEAQARTIINFRRALGGFRSAGEFAKSYAVTPEMFERLQPYIVIGASGSAVSGSTATDSASAGVPDGGTQDGGTQEGGAYGSGGGSGGTAGGDRQASGRVELNTADSVTLLSVRGIGPKTAAAILRYRQRLGGYVRAEQILDLRIVTEQNWALISKQIRADSCIIHKIDINFASPDSLVAHPYIDARLLRRILHNRQMKGGWNSIEDMIEDNTLTAEDARRLRPYLRFAD